MYAQRPSEGWSARNAGADWRYAYVCWARIS